MKTITITDNAYETMKKAKEPEESFSDLVLRTYGRRPPAKVFLGILKGGDVEKARRDLRETREKMNTDMEEKLRALRSR